MSKEKIVLLVLAVYPFGVLPKLVLGFNVMDALLIFLMIFGFALPKKSWGLLVVAGYSLFFGWALGVPYSAASALYLVRLVGVINLLGVVRLLVKEKKIESDLLISSLLVAGVVVLMMGLLQYLVWPDLRALKIWGWDDHYYRLVGTFLDPGFTGIIIVLALFLALVRKKYVMALAFLVGLGLTYSRASYLAFGAGMGYLFLVSKKKVWVLGFTALLAIMIPILPRPGGEGVKLTRTASITQRSENYKEAWQIIKTSPLLGVGFNNICAFKNAKALSVGVNSCAGLDNSLLFIWATTGVLGLIVFLGMGWEIWRMSSVLVRVSLVAVLTHSMFHNTLFYLWVMVWLVILTSVNSRGSR